MTKIKKRWIDETGLEIPENRITAFEKMRERAAEKLHRKAAKLNAELAKFKQEIEQQCEEIWVAGHKDAGTEADRIAKLKGNHTWYNFDRSIRVEVSVKGQISFDDILIAAAKDKFSIFSERISGHTEESSLIKEIINDAFQKRNGNLDPQEVFKLFRHRSRITESKYPEFHEALALIEKSIRRPDSKKYIRVSERDAQGAYHNIDLNFSSI
jgi:hypothetical protein